MKKLLFLIPAILIFASCTKDKDLPQVENIKKGSKWTLEIGSSQAEVYNQLQILNKEKHFDNVAIGYRKPYSKPEDIKDIFPYYNAITLESNSGLIQRAVIYFDENKVKSIEVGGGMLDSVSKWPQNIPEKDVIKVNDQTADVYRKLLDLYKIPAYSNYHITLPDKPLNKPYDPDMSNYREWYFTFQISKGGGKVGVNSVGLYFEKNKLVKIQNGYNEYQTYE